MTAMRWACAMLMGWSLVGCPRAGVMGPPPAEVTARKKEVREWYLRAAVATERGDYEEAERSLHWVRRFESPHSPWPYVAIGNLYEKTRRHEDAIGAYQVALDRREDVGPAHLGLGRVLVTRKLDAAAQGHLERAVALDPSDESMELLGRLYVRAGEAGEATAMVDAWTTMGASRAGAVRQVRLVDKIGCSAADRLHGVVAQWPGQVDLLESAAATLDRCEMADAAAALRERLAVLAPRP